MALHVDPALSIAKPRLLRWVGRDRHKLAGWIAHEIPRRIAPKNGVRINQRTLPLVIGPFEPDTVDQPQPILERPGISHQIGCGDAFAEPDRVIHVALD